jgi:hypothetical protein
MIRKKTNGPQVIDLTGPQGNAFALILTARITAKHFGLDPDTIINEMVAGDYEHLIQVFDRHFGEHFILER